MQRVVKSVIKKAVRTMLVTAALLMAGTVCGFVPEIQAKTGTKKITLDVTGKKTIYKHPGILDRAGKVRIKNSRKSVVSAKYRVNQIGNWIAFTPKKTGSAIVTVRCVAKNGKRKMLRYQVKVIKKKKLTPLEKGKKAFAIQNRFRREGNVAALKWSDELYGFCLYRLKTSGFDRHVNLDRDKGRYFKGYAEYMGIMFGENLAAGYSSPEKAMAVWKRSSGHYRNLMNVRYGKGAIAYYKGMWCAIFMDADAPALDNWQDSSLKKVTVKRYDSVSGTYVSGSTIRYYEADDKWGTMKVIRLRKESGNEVYLEVGKTYVFYEQVRPDGCGKAENVTITVTEDGTEEIVLSS